MKRWTQTGSRTYAAAAGLVLFFSGLTFAHYYLLVPVEPLEPVVTADIEPDIYRCIDEANTELDRREVSDTLTVEDARAEIELACGERAAADGTTYYLETVERSTEVTRTITHEVRGSMALRVSEADADVLVFRSDLSGECEVDCVPAGGSPDATILTSDSSFDCDANGIAPGDTVHIDGGPRGTLLLLNCNGTDASPITVKNDPNDTSPVQISSSQSGGFLFELRHVINVVVDGSGGWSGGPSGTCSGLTAATWPARGTRNNCGIQVTCDGQDPSSLVHARGDSTKFTLRGIEVNGNNPTCTNGSGFQLNDHSVKQADCTDVCWREDILFEDLYVHDTPGECVYFGPNHNVSDSDLPLRNNELRFIYMETCGTGFMLNKSTFEGSSRIHHNVGIEMLDLAGTGSANGISLFESGFVTVDHNWIQDVAGGPCYSQNNQDVPDTLVTTFPSEWRNNVAVDCNTDGFSSSRQDSADTPSDPEFENNTVIRASNRDYNVSDAAGCIVRNNIAAGSSTTISTQSGCTEGNNIEGTVAFHEFEDEANDNYDLTASSPALDTFSANCPDDDHEGVTRPQGSSCDAGAYEGP